MMLVWCERKTLLAGLKCWLKRTSEQGCLALAALTTAIVVLQLVTTPCAAQSSSADWVKLHNAARADVGVGPVSWNKSVAAYAQSYAELRQGDCELTLSNGTYGENLFWGTAGTDWNATDAVGLWVAQKQYYNNHGSNSCATGRRCGAYTQVVWSNTTAIGCARVVCTKSQGVFMICSYNPPGNDGESPY